MMKLINNYLIFVSKKKSQIILFILLNICGLLFIFLPYDIFNNMLDLYFSYDIDIVYKNFEAVGKQGRHFNLYSTLILDTIYPILYTSLILGIFVKLYSEKNKYIFTVPILVFFFDIAENIQLVYMNLNFMNLNEFQVMIASAFTSSKWIAVSIMLFLLFIGIIKKRF